MTESARTPNLGLPIEAQGHVALEKSYQESIEILNSAFAEIIGEDPNLGLPVIAAGHVPTQTSYTEAMLKIDEQIAVLAEENNVEFDIPEPDGKARTPNIGLPLEVHGHVAMQQSYIESMNILDTMMFSLMSGGAIGQFAITLLDTPSGFTTGTVQVYDADTDSVELADLVSGGTLLQGIDYNSISQELGCYGGVVSATGRGLVVYNSDLDITDQDVMPYFASRFCKFSPDGSVMVVTGTAGPDASPRAEIKVYNTSTWALAHQLHTFNDSPANQISFHPTLPHVAVAMQGARIARVFNYQTGAQVAEIVVSGTTNATGIAYNADGSRLYIASSSGVFLTAFDPNNSYNQLANPTQPGSFARYLYVSPAGDYIAAINQNGGGVIYNMSDMTVAQTLTDIPSVNGAAHACFSADGEHLAITYRQGLPAKINILDVSDWSLVGTHTFADNTQPLGITAI